MCSGLRDAANVAWKLELVLAGKAPDALLDTYATERVPHVDAVIQFSMELGKVICIADPAAAATRDQAMMAAAAAGHRIPVPAGMPIGPGVTRADDATAGQLFVQGHVRRAGATGLFDDVVGRGWTLIAAGGDPLAQLDAESAAFFASLGGVAAHIGDGGIDDVDGAYHRWLAEHGAGVVLQRPDFYVFGSAARVEDAGLLVRDLRGMLSN
jgi:3-(3-hydroxy-phenyl)propionate hydroxylase